MSDPHRTTKKEATAEVYIQFMGREVYTKNILSNVRRIWTDELGKKEKETACNGNGC